MTHDRTPTLYLTLAQAARLMPGTPAPSTIWRWARKGIAAADGGRVRLQHVRMGRRVFTTGQWLAKFGREVADRDVARFASDHVTPPQRIPPGERSAAQRESDASAAVNRMREQRGTHRSTSRPKPK